MDNSLRVCLVLFLAGTLVAAQRAATALGSAGVALRLRRNRARSLPPRPARNQAKSSAIKCYPLKSSIKAFTLIELIVVIIIVGILAAVGISQYSLTVEKSRLAEAKVRIGAMRQLVHEYWLNNGTLTGITDADVGVDSTCHSTDYYLYGLPGWGSGAQFKSLLARRCTTGGKTPNTTRTYDFVMVYYPGTGQSTWYCYYSDDSSPCFGYPSGYGTVW